MNKKVTLTDSKKYDFVFDGGTIEHIFNTPQVLENIVNFLNPMGIFCSVTVNNNFLGHGFYQFSPELFMRAFRPQYGMEIIKIYLAVEGSLFGEWKEINEQTQTNYRNEFRFDTQKHVYIITFARRLASPDRLCYLDVAPQQGNYEDVDWKK